MEVALRQKKKERKKKKLYERVLKQTSITSSTDLVSYQPHHISFLKPRWQRHLKASKLQRLQRPGSSVHFYTVNKSSLKKHDEIKKNCEISPDFYETCC